MLRRASTPALSPWFRRRREAGDPRAGSPLPVRQGVSGTLALPLRSRGGPHQGAPEHAPVLKRTDSWRRQSRGLRRTPPGIVTEARECLELWSWPPSNDAQLLLRPSSGSDTQPLCVRAGAELLIPDSDDDGGITNRQRACQVHRIRATQPMCTRQHTSPAAHPLGQLHGTRRRPEPLPGALGRSQIPFVDLAVAPRGGFWWR